MGDHSIHLRWGTQTVRGPVRPTELLLGTGISRVTAVYHFLLLLVLWALTACHRSPHSAFPEPSAAIRGKGCEIHQDASEVWHVRAAEEPLAYACFGFLHGRERAFQMDYLRRAAQGRLAEVLGMDSLRGDFFMRLMGLTERAQAMAHDLTPEDKTFLQAYTEGVNRGFQEALKGTAYEFRRLGYRPEPWRAEDTLAILLLQSFQETQATLWQRLTEERLREKHGAKIDTLLSREGLPWEVSILKRGEFPLRTTAQDAPTREPGRNVHDGYLPPEKPPVAAIDGTGSNSWVLSPKRSRSGKALFANDPHLELMHPPFWHWIHLQAGGLNVAGGALPGVPIIPSGLNEHLAWGLTDSYIDAGEIVAVPEEEAKAFAQTRPTIWVRLGFLKVPYLFKSFRRSPEGWPVLPIEAPAGRVLVLRWSGLLITGRGLSGFNRLMKSKTVQDADAFFSHFELPTFNFVFADTQGGIGYRAVGTLPRQDQIPPLGVRESRAGDLSRWAMLSPPEKPHAVNPPRGWIVTANNRQWDELGRFHLGRAHRYAFRAFRIEELLGEDKHDLDSLRRIQCDTQAVDARFLVPGLLKVAAQKTDWNAAEQLALDALKAWDYSTGQNCRACAVFERWIDRLGKDQGLERGPLYYALSEPGYWEGIWQSFSQAIKDLNVKDELPRWGDVHALVFPHLSKSSYFDSKERLPAVGNPVSVNPAGHEWENGRYRQISGASHRLLVEMASPPRAYFALAGSNNNLEFRRLNDAGSPWRRWRDCEFNALQFPFSWEGAKAEKVVF